jgi:hypothetical protein
VRSGHLVPGPGGGGGRRDAGRLAPALAAEKAGVVRPDRLAWPIKRVVEPHEPTNCRSRRRSTKVRQVAQNHGSRPSPPLPRRAYRTPGRAVVVAETVEPRASPPPSRAPAWTLRRRSRPTTGTTAVEVGMAWRRTSQVPVGGATVRTDSCRIRE